MLLNLSNHPYSQWDSLQREAARPFGECVDMAFPNIDRSADEEEILALAYDYAGKIESSCKSKDVTVHVMGEQTFCFAIITILLSRGIPCIASCSERDVVMEADGTKSVRFHFARFRHYTSLLSQ